MAASRSNITARAERRRYAIREAWSMTERSQRAERARWRTARLAALLLPRNEWEMDESIWAVGAPAIADLQRIAS